MIKENKILSKNEKLVIAFCRHIGRGFSENSFPQADFSDIEKIASDLDLSGNGKTNYKSMIETSKRKGRLSWEKIGFEGILEEKSKFNGSVWMFIMKSRFGWTGKQPDKTGEENKIVKVRLGFEEGNHSEEK